MHYIPLPLLPHNLFSKMLHAATFRGLLQIPAYLMSAVTDRVTGPSRSRTGILLKCTQWCACLNSCETLPPMCRQADLEANNASPAPEHEPPDPLESPSPSPAPRRKPAFHLMSTKLEEGQAEEGQPLTPSPTPPQPAAVPGWKKWGALLIFSLQSAGSVLLMRYSKLLQTRLGSIANHTPHPNPNPNPSLNPNSNRHPDPNRNPNPNPNPCPNPSCATPSCCKPG